MVGAEDVVAVVLVAVEHVAFISIFAVSGYVNIFVL